MPIDTGLNTFLLRNCNRIMIFIESPIFLKEQKIKQSFLKHTLKTLSNKRQDNRFFKFLKIKKLNKKKKQLQSMLCLNHYNTENKDH